MSANPAFASVPRLIDIATVSAANTNRDGTGTIVSSATGAAGGTRISSINIKPIATTTAGMIRMYLSIDSGSTWHLFDEFPISAVTPSATQQTYKIKAAFSDLVLATTAARIGFSTEKAEAFRVHVFGADL